MTPDWHPADIKARLEKRGTNLSRLAKQAGARPAAFAHVLRRPLATAERLIAEAIGVHPKIIWPSRYESNGRRKTPQPVNNYTPIHRASNQTEAELSQVEAG